ncbi:MAG: hypothetical protein ACTHU0_01640 [Kofleriaceae bacterium]
MKALPLFLVAAAACGGTDPATDTPDAATASDAPAPGEVTTLDELPFVQRLALAGDCLVATNGYIVQCVSLTGAPSRPIARLDRPGPSGPQRTLVQMASEGPHVYATSLTTLGDLVIDRISVDGNVEILATPGRVDPTIGAGLGIAIDGSRLVFTMNEELWSVPKAGGEPARLTTGGGWLGEVVAVGGQAFYVQPDQIYRYDLARPGATSELVDGVEVWGSAVLASDGARAIAATDTRGLESSQVYLLPDAPPLATLPGVLGRAVVLGDRAWVVSGKAIFEIELATGKSTAIVTGERAVDLEVTADAVYWATSDGAIRKRTR